MLSKTVTPVVTATSSVLRRSSKLALLCALALSPFPRGQAQSPLTSFEDTPNLQQNVFNLGADLHIHFRSFTAAQGWQQQDVTALAGAPAAAPATAIASFKDDAKNQQHIVFEAANGHIYQAYSNNDPSTWNVQDVTAVTGSAGAAIATPLVSFADSATGVQYIFYIGLNQHLNLLYWYGTWSGVDVTAATGTVSAATTSQLTGFVEPKSHVSHIFYEGDDRHIHELYAGLDLGAILTTDNTSSSGDIPAALGSPLASDFDQVRNQEHVYFLGMDQHVHHLQYNYTGNPWVAEDATSLAGTVAPALASSLTSFEDLTRDQRHVFYVGVDQHLHQLYRSGNANWSGEDVTLDAGSTLPTVATPLTSFKDDPNNQQHAFFFGTDTHLYHVFFSGRWNTQDLTPANPIPTL